MTFGDTNGNGMRKLLIIDLGLAALGLFVGVLWPFETRLSTADLDAITATTRKDTAEPILDVRPLSRWTVRVRTGKDVGPLSGGGHEYYLRYGWRGWRILKTRVWIS